MGRRRHDEKIHSRMQHKRLPDGVRNIDVDDINGATDTQKKTLWDMGRRRHGEKINTEEKRENIEIRNEASVIGKSNMH